MNTIRNFLLLAVSLTASVAMAQLSGGLKAGGNFTNFIGKDSKDFKYKPGFHVGLFMEYDFTEHLSFQPEVVYSTKGSKHVYENSTNFGGYTITQAYDLNYKLPYIDIPLLLNIGFGSMGGYIQLGPQLSLLMGPKIIGESTVTTHFINPDSVVSYTIDLSSSDKDPWSLVDFSVVFGTGSKFYSGIEYCLRAAYGLNNVFDPNNTTYENPYHNLVFSVSLGYAFGQTSGSYTRDKRYKGAKRRRR